MSSSPWQRPLDAPSAENLYKQEFAGDLINTAAYYNHKGLGIPKIIETLIAAAATITITSTGKSKEDREKTHDVLMELSRKTFDLVIKEAQKSERPQHEHSTESHTPSTSQPPPQWSRPPHTEGQS